MITTTLGKALGGASGGCVSGRRELVEMCRQRARPFLFSNSVAPVIVAGALKVMELITATTDRRDKLEWNAKYWRGLLKDAGFDIKEGESPIVPVMLYDAKLAQDFARDLFRRRHLRGRLLLSGRAQRTGAHSHAVVGRARKASPGLCDRSLQEGRREARRAGTWEEGVAGKGGRIAA